MVVYLEQIKKQCRFYKILKRITKSQYFSQVLHYSWVTLTKNKYTSTWKIKDKKYLICNPNCHQSF